MPSKPKILFITSYYEPAYGYGGPVSSSAALCKALVQNGINIIVITTNANCGQLFNVPLGEIILQNNVPVIYYPLVDERYFYSPKLVEAMKRIIPTCNLAFLQVFMTYAFYPAVRISLENWVPYVVPLRGQLLPWALSYKPFRKKVYMNLLGRKYLNCASALYCTDITEAVAVKNLGITTPTFTVNNMVDEQFFNPLPSKGYLRERFHIKDDHKIILFLGRLHPVKRPDIAIEALPDHPNTHLVIIGQDESHLKPLLIDLIKRSGKLNRIHFTDHLQRTDVIKSMADSDLLIMPSETNSENFGMTAAESMAVGLPVITTNSVPTGKMASRAGAGVIVPCSVAAFQEKIMELNFDTKRLKEMGEKGRILAREEFRSEKLVHEMITQIESIIAHGKPSKI